eukprot:scaffold3339_cov174-Amphora_coffeaeformis.AAC.12
MPLCRVLDVACGIGLQGQVLRLLGFRGDIAGTDVSPGMVQRGKDRGCHNDAFVANVNTQGLLTSLLGRSNTSINEKRSDIFDVVICTGAIELFDHPSKVLADMAAVTFQLLQDGTNSEDVKKKNPTEHQNVIGISQKEVIALLQGAGFCNVQSIQVCSDAFYTPSPLQDGTLLPVPYLFTVAKKAGNRDD